MNQIKYLPGDEPGHFNIETADGSNLFGMVWGEDHARRIVACVNACQGFETEALERHGIDGVMFGTKEWVQRLYAQRDQLLAALEVAREALDDASGNINPERGFADELEADVSSALDTVTAAIAAAKAGAQ